MGVGIKKKKKNGREFMKLLALNCGPPPPPPSRLFQSVAHSCSLIFQQCNPHDKESDYWGGARGAKQGYEVSHFLKEKYLIA